jgi:hypothetical protein
MEKESGRLQSFLAQRPLAVRMHLMTMLTVVVISKQ